jgi:hypothetical protein
MIDWWAVFSNAIWIGGAALALAVLSYASWQASVEQQRLRQVLGHRPIQAALNIAGALFSAGMAATAHYPLEIVIWFILAALFVYQGLQVRRAKH